MFIENPRNWKLGNAKEIVPFIPTDGEHYVMITDASYDESAKTYEIVCKDLNDDGDQSLPESERIVQREFKLRYWLASKDENGNIRRDEKAEDALCKLGKAINGAPCGVPYFKALKAGGFIIKAKLKGITSKKGTRYVICNAWNPLTKEEAEMLGRIDGEGNPLQYYEGLVIPDEAPVEYEEPAGTAVEE